MDRHNKSQEIVGSNVAINPNIFDYHITNNENSLSVLQKVLG